MAKYRARFNDKARAGGVAKRNALKQKRQKQFHRDESDSHPDTTTTNEEEEKALRQQRLHELARPESDARKRVRMAIQFPEKANASKRKRLDKYIEKQVRKEEKDELLRRLAETQKQIDPSSLHSLGALGTGSKAGRRTHNEADSASESESESESESDSEIRPQPKSKKAVSFADLESESESEFESESESGPESEPESERGVKGSFVPQESKKITSFADLESEQDSDDEQPKSTFIDHRPTGPALGQGGFGFTNLPTKRMVKPKKKPSWRDRLGLPAAEELLQGPYEDSSDSEESEESEESENSDKGGGESGEEQSEGEEESGEEIEEDEESEEGEESGEGEEGEESEESDGIEERVSTGKEFMEWAKTVEPQEPSLPTPKPQNYTHKYRETEGEAAAAEVDSAKSQPGWVERLSLDPVVVERTPEIEEVRTQLPAVASEQQIMDAVNHFDVVVITGATGSGKTTQIPQFLFENGYAHHGMIGVTQPRRVAAVSMAQRIKTELCGAASVGYQIRFDSKVGKDTKIKLMTDGVLLKEMSSDLILSKYSSIVVDEAHERSVNTDILIGLLSRVVKLRREQGNPLKLIVMSATLRVADFAENDRLFANQPPVINVEARQFPVTNHFSRRTATDYVEEAITKVRRIHDRLPKGGILVFLTGKDEILRVISELDPTKQQAETTVRPVAGTSTLEEENIEFGGDDDYIDDEDAGEDAGEDTGEDEGESDMELDPEQDPDMGEDHDQKKLHVLPLYSLLSTEDQLRVFEPVPAGHRLCVVATNVAETSLTIPGIRYVVDCGRSKQRIYDLQNGIQKYSVRWVSKASADQRSGRAGRTGPGHCYRLYSSAVYERDFPEFGDPEIVRMPVEGLVLQMKSMGIHHITNFPFPTAVPQSALESGMRILENLGALEITEPGSPISAKSKAQLTPLGLQMSLFPLHPRHAKMLLIGNQHGCLPFVVALVAALSVQDLFVGSNSTAPVLDPQADVLQLLSAVAAHSWTPTDELCRELGLRPKAMSEVASLRQQLARLVAQTLRGDAVATLTAELTKPLPVPTARQLAALRQIVAAGYIDQVVARKAMFDAEGKVSKQVSRQPYLTVQRDMPASTVYLHPNTIMQVAPDFVVYGSMTANDDTDKIRVRPLTMITETQLSALAAKTPLISYSKPMGGAYAPKMIDATTREVWVVPRYGASLGTGGLGWDLPPKKVVQIRKGTQWVSK